MSAETVAASASGPLSPGSLSGSAAAATPSSPSAIDSTTSLHATYHEFRNREKLRREAEEAEAQQIERSSHALDPVPVEADKPNAELLSPIKPFYSSALSDVAKGGGGSSSVSESLSARRPASARISMPGSGSGSSGSAASGHSGSKPAATKPHINERLEKLTESSKLRRELISKRKAEIAADQANQPLESDAFSGTPKKRDPNALSHSTASAEAIAAARPSSARPASASASKAPSSSSRPGSAVRKSLIPSFSSADKKSSASAKKSSNVSASSAKKKVAPSSGEKVSSRPSSASKASTFSQIKSAARATKGTFATRFEVLEPKGPRPASAQSSPQKEENFVVSPRKSTGSVLDQPLVRPAEEKSEPSTPLKATAASDATPSKEAQALAIMDSSNPASALAPRASQLVAALSPTPRSGAAPSPSLSMVPHHLQLANLPHSANKKVPLSLVGRSGEANDCSSCHALHMKVDRLAEALAKAQETSTRLEGNKVERDQAVKDRHRMSSEVEGLTQRLAKSEARCATMSNQLTLLRLDSEKHLRHELHAQSLKHSKELEEKSEKALEGIKAELESAKGKLEAALLEKKGLVQRLSSQSTQKRGLEQTLSSLESNYKSLQEALEVALLDKNQLQKQFQQSNALIEGGRDEGLQLRLEISNLERDMLKLKQEHSRALSELAEANNARENLEEERSLRTNKDALFERTKSSLQGAEERLNDLTAQLKIERDLSKQAKREVEEMHNQLEYQELTHKEHMQSTQDTAQLERSYKVEVQALREEVAQLQREKGESLEENMLLRKQLSNIQRQQRIHEELGAEAAEAESKAAAASAARAKAEREAERERQQAAREAAEEAATAARLLKAQQEQEKRVAAATAAAAALEEEDELEAERQAPPQPRPQASRIPSLSASKNNSRLSTPRAPTTTAAQETTPSPQPRKASPSPSSYPMKPATPVQPTSSNAATAAATPRTSSGLFSPGQSSHMHAGPVSRRSKSPNPIRVSSPRTDSTAMRSSSLSPSRFPSSPGSSSEEKEKLKMLHSLQFFKAHYPDDSTQQTLLVLEGLMQQASILQAKVDDKKAALAEAERNDASGKAEERLRAELRVIGNTLDLTKDNIRSHWHNLLASLASNPNTAAPAADIIAHAAATSSPKKSATISSAKGLFTVPNFNSPIASATQQHSFSLNNGTGSVTGVNPSSRFANWSANYAAGAAKTNYSATTGGLFSPSNTLRYSALSSPTPAATAAPLASSSYFNPSSTTGNIHRSLSSFNTGIDSASTSTGNSSFVVPPPPASSQPQMVAGGSTFNLQVSKDAKNIYITHQSHPAQPAAAAASSSFSTRPALTASTPAAALAPPTSTSSFNLSSLSSTTPFARAGAPASSNLSFNSPAPDRYTNQHTSFNTIASPLNATKNTPASFLSPSTASVIGGGSLGVGASGTPYSARSFSTNLSSTISASPSQISAATMPTNLGHRF